MAMVLRKRRKYVLSKWIKTKVLLGNGEARSHIPDTRKLSKSTLTTMLKLYGMVYVKPEIGTHGKGVIRVEKRGGAEYAYQLGTKEKSFRDYETFYQSLLRETKKKSYLIQKGIHLVKYKKRRFDIRVMVQLSPKGVWETTALIGRVAPPEKIVTNYHSGGKLMDVRSLLGSHLSESKMKKVMHKLDKLGVATAGHLHKKYPGIRQIGLDIGFDHSWIPWIIEVNTNPDPYIFNKLSDKSMYRKVMRYRGAALKHDRKTVTQ
ncbi:YheC/YheD family protein [Paenibacillus motobuensis]|uniref:YheC/YheD family protein n=1 Tax=Paenibacillus TaxID=44249 RepID=UPI0020405F63|nr:MULTISPECIES: YheC/YheD family protein [Paenibacillus]MCM3039712.1 YheC/YheD family protein [Paenibacillus lutimineralis]MCM3646816.1 YheC/YheD family protein [Paenibacillus motobuensis]